MELLAVTEEALTLAQAFIAVGPMPPKALEDAIHIAIAVTSGVEYLLTWNCTHLANATMRKEVERLCRARDYEPVIVCTPEELTEA